MGSKAEILASIRGNLLEAVELPQLDGPWITFDNRRGKFAEMVEAVGGSCLPVANRAALNQQLAQFSFYREAESICSLVPGVERANLDLADLDDPHELETVDIAILPGMFGVAENGAVWINDENLKHRALYFIVQHLVLVMPGEQIVDNMHQAYEKLRTRGDSGPFAQPGFGTFLSGPSKTADIEQSLVIGAHGARSLTLFLLDE